MNCIFFLILLAEKVEIFIGYNISKKKKKIITKPRQTSNKWKQIYLFGSSGIFKAYYVETRRQVTK